MKSDPRAIKSDPRAIKVTVTKLKRSIIGNSVPPFRSTLVVTLHVPQLRKEVDNTSKKNF